MASLNKVMLDLYQSGLSLPDVASKVGKGISTVRYHIKKAGVLRSRTEGLRLSSEKMSRDRLGKKRGPMKQSTRKKLSHMALERSEISAVGYRTNSQGYIEFTRGPQKGKSLHCIIAEAMLGRPLMMDEVVHHVDGNKKNNTPSNLMVLTNSEHVRVHRLNDHKNRERDEYGRFA